MFTFPKPGPAGVPCQAHFYTWTQLSELCSTLFTGFFGRPTPVQAVGEFNRDSWSLKFLESPLSYEDLTAIFTALKADDYDRDANDAGAYPVWGLSQSLCQKLVSLTLPFPVAASHTSDGGIWFTGNTAEYGVAVIRQRCDGRNSEIYYSSFQIAQDRLPEPSEAACEAYLRKIIYDFLQTEVGKRVYEETCRDFNWGDVETEIPDDFFSAYHCLLSFFIGSNLQQLLGVFLPTWFLSIISCLLSFVLHPAGGIIYKKAYGQSAHTLCSQPGPESLFSENKKSAQRQKPLDAV